MYAIVNISGEQFRVEKGEELRVPRQKTAPGKKITYDRVLLLDDGNEIKIGRPTVSGSTVEVTVVDHGRTKRIPVFKKKRRKGYRVKNTHRQDFTLIRVDAIKKKRAVTSKSSSGRKKPSAKQADVAAGE